VLLKAGPTSLTGMLSANRTMLASCGQIGRWMRFSPWPSQCHLYRRCLPSPDSSLASLIMAADIYQQGPFVDFQSSLSCAAHLSSQGPGDMEVPRYLSMNRDLVANRLTGIPRAVYLRLKTTPRFSLRHTLGALRV
jgi:hypothetical protein